MKQSEEQQKFSSNVTGSESQKFTVSNDSLLMQRLSSQIYSRPVEAIVRELSTNAYDSHAEAKQTKPFEVYLPYYQDTNFKIQDYGTGLSKDQLLNIYTKYGESTRRDSNDYVGNIGIGSKSPIAYTDLFNIVSVKDGKKTTAVCYKDSSGIPTLDILSEEDTKDPSGFLVSFPVASKDYYKFAEAAQKVYPWFDKQPKVFKIGRLLDPFKKPSLEKITKEFQFHGGDSKLVMGNVLYNVDTQQTDHRLTGFYIFADIGDVDINVSREELQYNPKTVKFLKQKAHELESAISSFFKESIEKAENYYKACNLYTVIKGKYKNFKFKELKYKEQELQRYIKLGSEVQLVNAYFNNKIKEIDADHDIQFIYQDIKVGVRDSARNFLRQTRKSNYGNYALVVNDDNRASVQDVLGIDYSTLPKLSTYYVKTTRNSNARPGDIFKMDFGYRGTRDKQYLITLDEEPDYNQEAFYLPINRYTVTTAPSNHFYSKILNALVRESIKIKELPVFGVRKKGMSKVTNKWTNLHTYLESLVESNQHIYNGYVQQVIADNLNYKHDFLFYKYFGEHQGHYKGYNHIGQDLFELMSTSRKSNAKNKATVLIKKYTNMVNSNPKFKVCIDHRINSVKDIETILS